MEFTSELAQRTARCFRQGSLMVDYYRIRRRIGVPLPIRTPPALEQSLRAFSADYPWFIWLMWALEDRIVTLGSSARYPSDAVARPHLEADLRALAGWKSYRRTDKPDLPFSHAVRILWLAHHKWKWLDSELREEIERALDRATSDALPSADRLFASFEGHELPATHEAITAQFHNIEVIGCCALALAAKAARHPHADRLESRACRLVTALLDARAHGFTEGPSYDGYAFSFVLDWLSTADETARASVLAHPRLQDIATQVLASSAPGDLSATAPIGDVEPCEMLFVWSAIAKLHALTGDRRLAWALARIPPRRLRADALVALVDAPIDCEASAPQAGPLTLNYACVLRTGFESGDVAAVMGFSRSPMGHVHFDNGSIVIGTTGRWWLDDPGYQQYLDTSERRFTIGPAAHNAPVIDGHAQTYKRPQLLAASRLPQQPEVQLAWVDLTACYPADANAQRVCRATWLIGRQCVVVCDQLVLAGPARIDYHWHGHKELYWEVGDGTVTLVSDEHPETRLSISSPQFRLESLDVERLRGSRGQSTLSVSIDVPASRCVWWIFSLSPVSPAFGLEEGRMLLDGKPVELGASMALDCHPLAKRSRLPPLTVTAERNGAVITASCIAGPDHFDGEVEYAFYLLVDRERAQVKWYTADPEVRFVLERPQEDSSIEVRAFVRERLNPEKKVAKSVKVI